MVFHFLHIIIMAANHSHPNYESQFNLLIYLMQKWRNEKQKRMQRNVQLNRIKYDYCLKMRWVRKRTVWRGEKEDKQKVNKRDLLETNENRTEEFKNSETKKRAAKERMRGNGSKKKVND